MNKIGNNIVFLSHGEIFRLGTLYWLSTAISEAYQKLSQTYRMKLFAKIVMSLKPSTNFSKASS